MMRQQTSLFGRLEDAIRKHERMCSEKAQLEENIKLKEQENEELKAELKRLDGAKGIEQLENTINRISACDADVSELREKVKELQSIIEEQIMLIKRGKSTMKQGLITFCVVAEKKIRESFETKESEYKVRLLEAEKKQEIEDELRAQVQSLEHKVALQEKDLQMKDLELSTHQNQRKRELTSEDLELPQSKRNALEEVDSVGQSSGQEETGLVVPTLRSVIMELDSISSSYSNTWEKLGIALNVKYSAIQRFREELNESRKQGGDYDTAACLTDTLNSWLQRKDPPPSYTELVEALEHIGQTKEAENVRSKYTP